MPQKLRPQAETLYGLPQPLQTGLFPPVIAKRDPTTSDTGFPLGQTWDDKSSNKYWVLLSVSAGSATWLEVVGNGGASVLGVANGGTGDSTLTAHGVLIGEGTNPVAVTAAGTDGQVLTANTGADPTFDDIGTKSGLTAHGVLIAEGTSAFVATAVGATGTVLAGSTGADPSFTGSPTLSGNLSFSTSGDGIITTPVIAGPGATPQTANARTFEVTFSSVSIGAASQQSLVIDNSLVTSSTIALLTFSGASSGAALTMQSVTYGTGTITIVMQNGTGNSATTANITFVGMLLN